MARTAEEISEELKESIITTDPTWDVLQGPIPDLFIRPQSGQLSTASQEAESLRKLFTLQFDEEATDDEIRSALANYGSTPGVGGKSRHIQYFMRFTRPTIDIPISAGSLVSNIDGTLVYQVLTTTTMVASNANIYFNPSRNAYEIGVLVEATSTGADYNLPQFRVNTLVTPINGIDSTENRVASSGGFASEDIDSQTNRLKTALLGINLGAPGGIEGRILNTYPELITDVQTIQPYEKEFARLTATPALDIYVIGNQTESTTITVTAIAGQTQIPFDNVPVESISSVSINGVPSVIPYSLVQDLSPETGKSLKSTDIIVFDSPLLLGDVVVIEYVYNKLLNNIQTNTLKDTNEYLFNTDILLRSPFTVAPKITGDVRVLPSYTVDEVTNSLNSFIANYFTFTTFNEVIFPEVFRQELIAGVSGIQSFKIREFRRSTGSTSDIEPMFFAKNEISVYDGTLINIKVQA